MTILVYKTGGHLSRSMRGATLVAEIDVEPEELPFDLTKFARRHGGTFVEVVYDNTLFKELQTA